MPGLQQAHHYVWSFCQRLQAAAEADGGQLVVSAAFENYTGGHACAAVLRMPRWCMRQHARVPAHNTTTPAHCAGAFAFDFVGESFINAHHNISNIVLHISRRGPMEALPAVMLVAHHDSPVGSPGERGWLQRSCGVPAAAAAAALVSSHDGTAEHSLPLQSAQAQLRTHHRPACRLHGSARGSVDMQSHRHAQCAGAGDDASNVGVMMELASNLVAAPEAFPSSPVMLLFSGAEEPLCQARCRLRCVACGRRQRRQPALRRTRPAAARCLLCVLMLLAAACYCVCTHSLRRRSWQAAPGQRVQASLSTLRA